MADFLDRYGEQLRRARRLRRRRRLARTSALVPLAAAAIAVFALPVAPDEERPAGEPPAVGTWTPKVGRPNVGLGATIDRSPVSSEASDVLAVLRRPQTARDRVRFTPEGGRPKDSIVRENFYETRVPGPGPAQGTLEWFDARGKLIKRTRE